MLQLTHQPPRYNSLEEELHEFTSAASHPCDEVYDVPHEWHNQFLGEGYFSSVWAIPGEPFQVMKVSHRQTDACRHYLRWLQDHPHPNAPKIHSIVEIGEQMFIQMDRYYRHPDYDYHNRSENVPGNKVLVLGHHPNHELGHEQLCATIRREFSDCKFDLHRDNIMVDRDGNVIITDPMSYFTGENGYIIR